MTTPKVSIFYVTSTEADLVRRVADVQKIKGLLVDNIITWVSTADDDFVAECEKYGLGIIAERRTADSDYSEIAEVLDNYGSQIRGVLMMDDVDSPAHGYTVAQVRAGIATMEEIYDGQLYISGGYVARIGSYLNLGPRVLMQGYPVGNGDETAADAATYWAAGSAGGDWAPVVQSFLWENQRYPKKAEIKSMVNQAREYNPAEFAFYTYLDEFNDMTASTTRRLALRDIIKGIKWR